MLNSFSNKINKFKACFLLLGTFFILPFYLITLFAQGSLLIIPKRVVFEGSERSEELYLANTGNDTATYIISIVQIRMKEDGSFEQIIKPDSLQKIASNNLRFSPRSVTLGPNESESIKVQLIKANELKTGEYRSHMYFRATLSSDRALGEETTKNDSSTISVQLIPIFGITMPVLIRIGEPNLRVSLSNLSVETENLPEPILKMTFNRTGDFSSYGDVTVTYISIEGKSTRVGLIRGLAVYTPNDKRNFQLKLDIKQNIDYHSGKLQVTYTDQSGKATKLAEEVLILK